MDLIDSLADDSYRLLKFWVQQGMEKRGAVSKKHFRRIAREMKMIREKGFTNFFLITSDAVRWAKRQKIAVGPARGSAAASLVCYVLWITEIDPIEYPAMMLERFLDPNRSDIPDIDLDFDDERRDEVRVYLENKYGQVNVGNVANHVRFGGRAALQAIGSAHSIGRGITQAVADLVVDRGDGDDRRWNTLEDTIGLFPQVQDAFERFPDLADALRLEGQMKSPSVHAAGLIISTQPLTACAALYSVSSGTGDRKRNLRVLSLDKYDAEYLGLLKADFLGLTTMGMIAHACHLAGIELTDLYAVPDTDKKSMEGFRSDDVTGIFQFDGRATRGISLAVQPRTFMELADIVALSRPGALNEAPRYVANDRESRRKMPVPMQEITAGTRGVIIYQEQIILVAMQVGGLSFDQANKIRKIVAKKLGESQFNSFFEPFAKGAEKIHKIRREEALKIWHSMSKASAYAFNTAHSVSYAKLALWCMYLKQHYPIEFFTASLQKCHPSDDKERVALLIRDAEAHGFRIGKPRYDCGHITWHLRGDVITPGFIQVPGIGSVMSHALCDEHDRQPFESWGDLLRVKGVGQVTVRKMQEFANSDDPFGIHKAGRFIASVRKAIVVSQKLPLPDCDSQSLLAIEDRKKVTWCGLIRDVAYRDLAEDERAAGNPDMTGIKSPHLTRSVTLKCYDDGAGEVYLRIGRFQYRKFARQVAEIVPGSDGILITGRAVRGFGAAIRVDRMWVIADG
jgi:DNA polymerase-3 subunit alpha